MLSVPRRASDATRWLGVFLLSLRVGVSAGGTTEMPASLSRDYSITVFDQGAGFSDYALASVAAAPDGWLWYCSFGAVGRFDGDQFTDLSAITNSPVAGIRPRNVCVDRAGRVWVGATGCIFCYETNSWLSFGATQEVPGELIRSLAEDATGVLWAASASNVVRRAGERFEKVAGPADLPDEVCHLAVEQDSTVWCAGNVVLSRFERGRFVPVLDTAQTVTNKLRGLLPARSGGLWVAFERDIKLRQGDSWTKVLPRPEAIRGDVVEMLEDSQGNLWVGGWRSGLVVYSPAGTVRQATTREGLANDSVSGITEDREGNIWLSSNGGGLVRLRPLAFRSYGQEAGLTQIANSVSEASPGRMWIGTHGDGVALWENQRVTAQSFWPETNFMAGVWVHGVLQDRAGDTWAATYSPGLLRLHYGAWSRVPTSETGARIILSLFEDREGRLWVGTVAGLAVSERGVFSVCKRSSGLPTMTVRGIGQDGAGDIWVCGPGDGLFRRRAGGFSRFVIPGVATNAAFEALLGGRDGSMWVGIGGRGVARIRGEACFVFGPEHGLPTTEIGALLEDDLGDLWLGGAQGVTRLNRASLEAVAGRRQARLVCQVFGKLDGLPGQVRAGFQPVAWKVRDGRLWFATLRGVAVVDPARVMPAPPAPDVTIAEVLVDGQRLDKWQWSSGPLRLPDSVRQLDVRYSVVRLGTSERLRFQRRLCSGDAWVDAGKDRFTHLHDLRPGHYCLEVRAADIDNVWGASAKLEYVVLPHFWQRAWFVGLMFASAGGVGWLVYRQRLAGLDERRQAQATFARQLMDREEQWRHRIAVD